MTRALVNALRDWHEEQPARPSIRRVVLEVGAFTTVEPDALRFAFDVQRRSVPFLGEATLSIEEIPLVAYCGPCATEYRPQLGVRYAHDCGAPMEEIRSGRELRIAAIETEEAVHA